jgi:hypothetical protein
MSKALKNIVVDLVVIVQVEGPSNDESIWLSLLVLENQKLSRNATTDNHW